jgi:hypothetical protein
MATTTPTLPPEAFEFGPFESVAQIRTANENLGHYWFSVGALKFFSSRVIHKVYFGRFFVSSEQFEPGSPRLFTVRMASNHGAIFTIGKFQEHKSEARAIAAIDALWAENKGPR